jgi:MFS transporter, UMF1 family
LSAQGVARKSWIERLGLQRPELRAWAMYDWANSSFWATTIHFFPIYFVSVACAGAPGSVGSSRFGWATFIAMLIVAVLAPWLGAIADHTGRKKRLLIAFMAAGVPAAAALALVGRGQWVMGAAIFIVANIGITGSLVFYDSLLPHIAAPGEVDRVSTAGYALGYLGSGLLMALNVAWIAKPRAFGIPDQAAAIRLSLLSAAIWWLAFSLPLIRHVREPAATGAPTPGVRLWRVGFLRLWRTAHELRRYRQAFLLLAAFLFYNDGINTIIRMAVPYGTEVGISAEALLGAILLVQFVGVPFTFLFGMMARRIGAKRAILLGLAVYLVITLIAYSMRTAGEFFALAMLVGVVQGGTQALSRSLFATLIPTARSAEFFGLFGVSEKFSAILGPGLFALMIDLTGSGRSALLAIAGFFAIGAVLLARLDVQRGQEAARASQEGAP